MAIGILAFAEEEAPDNYVQKIVRSAQDSAPSQAGNGIVSISKSLTLKVGPREQIDYIFTFAFNIIFLWLLINYLKSKEIHNNLNPEHFLKLLKPSCVNCY